ncbi:polysaccharide deacetylase family protein [Dethiobacter alkaliphilus]|uniref:Glycoside hydrolase family 16 n=1 Tax=Dethiobacter alkaliphilus AHT 1 TaxID=555088 RepID=C0GFE1_DETAL|nr:family 16 glycosylhydrolase [Dethiobacter alkaliphilus]EEG77901.1 glycoside hydrolase family 16 [Dethiobacter alkaliphilus AHT 1]
MGKAIVLIILCCVLVTTYVIFSGSLITTAENPNFADPGAARVESIAAEYVDTIYFNKGRGQERLVSLTFDDGPDKVVTPEIINILNSYGVKGNFFFIGENVLMNPDVVRYAYYDGHLVLNHSFFHDDYTGKSADFIGRDIDRTSDAFKEVIGEIPVLFRPPEEIITHNLLTSIKERDFKIVTWSLDTLDWRVKDKDTLVRTVLDNITPGGIVLMHSIAGNEATAEALPEIIEGLHAKGYEIVTLDRLLRIGKYENAKSKTVTAELDTSLSTDDWEIVWHDEFTGDSIDLTKWNVVEWASDKNNELQYYSYDNVIVNDGYLQLVSKKENYKNRNYTSGAVETKNKFALHYGKVEIRARLPKGQGVFPALWLLADNRTSLPEIDIMEMLGHEPNKIWMVYHYIDKYGRQRNPNSYFVGPDFSEDFHTFGIEWDQDKLVWLVDGEEWFSITEDVPDTPLYLYMNTAIGGDWPGSPDNTTRFPQYFDIDYVRIWKKR